jgi:hypothetical protein
VVFRAAVAEWLADRRAWSGRDDVRRRCWLSGALNLARSDLDRVTRWLVVHGMVHAVPGSAASMNVLNNFSDPCWPSTAGS